MILPRLLKLRRQLFNQLFRDGYFHADMHPGNIFVTSDGLLVPIDFGIMGQLDFADRLFLRAFARCYLNRDYDKVAVCIMMLACWMIRSLWPPFPKACEALLIRYWANRLARYFAWSCSWPDSANLGSI